MTTEQEEVVQKVSRAEWIAVAAFAVSILGGVFNIGVVYADLQAAKNDIVALQNTTDALVPKVERIDANVEFLTDLAKEERERRIR